jgi:hypothetical protein
MHISQPQGDYIRKLLFGEAKSGRNGLITLQNYLLAHPFFGESALAENDPVQATGTAPLP